MSSNAQDSADYHDDKDQVSALRENRGIHCGELFVMVSLAIFLMALGVHIFLALL